MFRAHSLELDTSQTHEWEEDAIVSYSKGTHSMRICSSGKLRKGFAREATVAPKDADRMGVRHDAAAKPEPQKIAAANANTVNPLREASSSVCARLCVQTHANAQGYACINGEPSRMVSADVLQYVLSTGARARAELARQLGWGIGRAVRLLEYVHLFLFFFRCPTEILGVSPKKVGSG